MKVRLREAVYVGNIPAKPVYYMGKGSIQWI